MTYEAIHAHLSFAPRPFHHPLRTLRTLRTHSTGLAALYEILPLHHRGRAYLNDYAAKMYRSEDRRVTCRQAEHLAWFHTVCMNGDLDETEDTGGLQLWLLPTGRCPRRRQGTLRA